MTDHGRQDARLCAGCLDSTRCWPCEGAGVRWDLAAKEHLPCPACAGRGLCRLCRPASSARVGDGPVPERQSLRAA